MAALIYPIIAVVVLFVQWKRIGVSINYDISRIYELNLSGLLGLLAIPWLWPISLFIILLWWLLEQVYRLIARIKKKPSTTYTPSPSDLPRHHEERAACEESSEKSTPQKDE